jgi:hypothetical protein
MDRPIQQTLADAVELLRSWRLSFALIGGLATSLRGQPRVTADVDIVTAAGIDDALRLARGLGTTKFRPLFADVEEVILTSFLLPLRHRSTNVKVDIAVGLTGFEQSVVARAEVRRIGDCDVPIATAEDLLIMKALAGRPQDDQDLEGLVISQGKNLDWDYCMKVAAGLGAALGEDLVKRVRELRESQDCV